MPRKSPSLSFAGWLVAAVIAAEAEAVAPATSEFAALVVESTTDAAWVVIEEIADRRAAVADAAADFAAVATSPAVVDEDAMAGIAVGVEAGFDGEAAGVAAVDDCAVRIVAGCSAVHEEPWEELWVGARSGATRDSSAEAVESTSRISSASGELGRSEAGRRRPMARSFFRNANIDGHSPGSGRTLVSPAMRPARARPRRRGGGAAGRRPASEPCGPSTRSSGYVCR